MENDPTLEPGAPTNHDRQRAVYLEAFITCFEFLICNRIFGEILEFGTYRGFTARILATIMAGNQYPGNLYLFDSFEGLPEIASDADRKSYEVLVKGVWAQGNLKPEAGVEELIRQALLEILRPEQLHVIKGYFEDTLDANLPDEKAALVHVDCDLYASAKFTLQKLIERNAFQDGCLLLFDDFNCNRGNPMMGERLALREAFHGHSRYSYSPFITYGWHGQAFIVHDKLAPHILSEIHKDQGHND